MDNDLVDDIKQSLQAIPEVEFVSPEEASEIISKVEVPFVSDPTCLWWWESLSVPCKYYECGEADGSVILAKTLETKGPRFFMVIIANERRLWPVLRGTLSGIVALLSDTWRYEYFLLDESFSWVLFDTHHNVLIAAGEIDFSS